MLVGDLGVAGRNPFDADGAGQRLSGDLTVAVHEDQQGLAVLVLHDQRLDDQMFVDLEFTRELGRAAALDIGVGVALERHAGGAQHTYSLGDGFLGGVHRSVHPLDQYGIDWVNQNRESGDTFKFLIYGKVGGGRQIGIYNRKTTVIRLECYDQLISGVTVLAKCAITHTSNADYSHFQNGKGICISVDNLTALKALFDWYFRA